ncbi:MAG TPA: N-acetylglucosamine-6-phosphate deacetylase, partial [Lachnoclostridium sp.]|nr:N-acetylglucosamine-6-phosphate deacetylase [Lachnoclostridium sp.]
ARHTSVDWFDIMRMTSLNPARYIHADDRKGSIEPGKDADLTIVDSDLNLVSVFCRGKEIRE